MEMGAKIEATGRLLVMKKNAVFMILLILFAPLTGVMGQEDFTPREISFIIYTDGYVAVDYSCDLDPTLVRVNVTLFGSLYLDVLVLDQDELPLDYSQFDDGFTLDSLGAASALISYVTTDLTAKDGQIWSFTVDSPVTPTILLPEGATIVSMNAVPLEMGSLDDNVLLTMPEGELEISYTIGVVGTREHAQAIIRDAEDVVDTIKGDGVIVTEAESLLEEANNAFDGGLYAEAEQLAGQAKTSAQATLELADSASEAIETADSLITSASNAGRTEGLAEAETLYEQAEAAYVIGDYAEADSLALEAQTAALDAEKPETPGGGGIPVTWVFGGLAVVVIAAAVFFYTRRSPAAPKRDKFFYNIDALFAAHPQLRMDDKEVIRFLNESGGSAFAAEIRERFDVPRTSLWRMIRRLEGEGVITVETIGGQSLVKISDMYREGGQ